MGAGEKGGENSNEDYMTIVKAAIFLLAAASFGVTLTKPIAAKASKRSFTTRRPQPPRIFLSVKR